EKAEQIKLGPLLGDPAIRTAVDEDPAIADALPRGRHSLKLAQMGPLKVVAHGDLIPLVDQIIRGETQVGEGSALTTDKLAVLLGAMQLSPGIVPHEIRGEELVDPA